MLVPRKAYNWDIVGESYHEANIESLFGDNDEEDEIET